MKHLSNKSAVYVPIFDATSSWPFTYWATHIGSGARFIGTSKDGWSEAFEECKAKIAEFHTETFLSTEYQESHAALPPAMLQELIKDEVKAI